MSDETEKTRNGRGEYLTARQIAEVLQVSESTVRKLARAGRIPVVRVTSRLTRYNLQSVLRALDGDGASKSRSTRRAQSHEKDDDPQLSFEDLI
ncbi:MAG: Helix-turn-helix domain [Acidobacteriota bacterium]|jgi:excisionase family DNA binding protein|nr:Helix-turn-helix domain [Acidobacteriota bacterium]